MQYKMAYNVSRPLKAVSSFRGISIDGLAHIATQANLTEVIIQAMGELQCDTIIGSQIWTTIDDPQRQIIPQPVV